MDSERRGLGRKASVAGRATDQWADSTAKASATATATPRPITAWVPNSSRPDGAGAALSWTSQPRFHDKAAQAQDDGVCSDVIVAVTNAGGVEIVADECIRRGGSVEALGRLSPVFTPTGCITAGNSSQISDGAPAVLITTSEKASALDPHPYRADPFRRSCGTDPIAILTGPTRSAAAARAPTTLLHYMRDHGIRHRLQTMCEGGGQANAIILELL